MYSTLTKQLQSAGARLAERYPSPVRPLATPPPGSELAPVLGRHGPPGIGFSLNMISDQVALIEQQLDRFGPVSWIGGPGRSAVLAVGPEAAETVLLDRDKAFSAERGYGFAIGPFFRGGILLRDLDDHKYHRRILQQAFTRPRLVGYLDITTPAIERRIHSWEPGSGFPFYVRSRELLLDIATEVFLGSDLGPESTRIEQAFIDTVHSATAIVRTNAPGGSWSRGLRGRRVLEEYFRRELPVKRSSDSNDLFSVLCRTASQEGHTFSDQDIVDHMIFVLLAAFDTSTIALSMMTYQLAKNPQWQDRLRAESLALGKSTLDYDDLDQLPSMDLVFRESLRMNAPVGVHFRETVKDTEILGQFVPADTLVIVPPYANMRLDRWWHDPDTFDPERFSPERAEDKSHRYAWAPFGAGAHKCIGLYFAGMTVKAIMHQMLLGYRWSVPDDYDVPLVWGTGPVPSDGLPIDFVAAPVDAARSATS
ncbi:cytochrome P450 [Nocardia sp. NPDC051030]|uniref:cytochrome P450 n=1 Tax=Nocardia sp. NPDC051030 TaxID=3155162 RepID=UPI003444CBB2